MGRMKTRSSSLDLDTIGQIRRLFGTIKNAHDLLGLQIDVPYATFYQAMQFKNITPAHKDVVMRRWERWRSIYLAPDCPVTADMQLNPMDEALDPEWKTPAPSTAGKTKPSGRSSRR